VPKPLAEIAIDAGLASRDQVVEASRRADADGEPLVVALVRRLAVDELALVSAIRRQMRVPLSDPVTVKLDPDALREVARDVCRRLRVLPLSVAVYDKGPRLLRLAMADPTDAVAIAEIEHRTGCRVDVSLMPLSAIEEMVEDGYREFVTEVISRKPAFGGNLRPARPPVAPRSDDDDDPTDDGGSPTTMPYHRLSDEADITIRHRALLELLLEKKLISEDEFEEKVRQLMRRESGDI
jgi:hypothetical protein